MHRPHRQHLREVCIRARSWHARQLRGRGEVYTTQCSPAEQPGEAGLHPRADHSPTSSTSVEQEGAQLDVLSRDSPVKRRLLIRGTDNTSIKIQPTDTQVSVSRRGNKPFPVDGTTLLTSRVSSTHSQRRHSIDAAAFRKRENILLFHGTPAHLQAHLLAVHPLRQRRANSVLESGEAAALFPHLHLHLRTSPRRRDVHCCVACVDNLLAASFWMPRAVEGGQQKEHGERGVVQSTGSLCCSPLSLALTPPNVRSLAQQSARKSATESINRARGK